MDSAQKKPIITICSSISFYKDVVRIERSLKKLGFRVKIPASIGKMKQSGKDESDNRPWLNDVSAYAIKTKLMKGHFRKVVESDGILVVNMEKHGMAGYIGGNVLMEMVIAFQYKKPIYILNAISEDLGYKEEVYGLEPVFLQGKLEKISLK